MKLHFPNPSRSYDESKDRLLFWGYDGALEVSFYLEVDALKQNVPGMGSDEKGYLKAFDDARDRIYSVADRSYERGGSGKGTYAYVLSANDF
ncbi:MAG: DUF1488 domain-containing protein [Sedimenticola sp.]|nr:DUF1488 domain-containing protein [Sedimenticola sp.]